MKFAIINLDSALTGMEDLAASCRDALGCSVDVATPENFPCAHATLVYPGRRLAEVGPWLTTMQSATLALPFQLAVFAVSPSIRLMTDVFDAGCDRFLGSSGQMDREVLAFFRSVIGVFSDPNSVESHIMRLGDGIARGKQEAIVELSDALRGFVADDWRAAWAMAKGAEARGAFEEALELYSAAFQMNRLYTPAAAGATEIFLLMGEYQRAQNLLKHLERCSPGNFASRAALSCLFSEQKDFVQAQSWHDAAAKLAPGHSRVLEAEALILLGTGRVQEAIKLVDRLQGVGSFFAAKLNDVGIELSKAGDTKTAVLLYEKAHKVVRPEIKYKISMNAALACRKMRDWAAASQLVSRCEAEYGSIFPKLEKLKAAIQLESSRAGEP